MANNFEFLEDIDKELYNAIEDAQKLYRDEYFNQCAVQLRVFAEKMAKRVLGSTSLNLTFDDTLNCLKDKIKSESEREFIDDLFFIKKQGNKCAHGEDVTPSEALEAVQRAFEASINYAYSRKKDDKILKLQFDTTLLVTGQKQQEIKLVDKYIQLANEQKEELLNAKQGEFNFKVDKNEEGIRNESYVSNPKKYKEKKINPKREKIKSKIKEAKKNLKQNINNDDKKPSKTAKKQASKPLKKKTKKQNKKQQKRILKLIAFWVFVFVSVTFIAKMLQFF
ncbi:MAG: hypothetical protein E7Z88_00760 [Cyanobacteria bacterium SIG27]|nr:hypothetical protein [Cyanobacteria bacterium SIG27]